MYVATKIITKKYITIMGCGCGKKHNTISSTPKTTQRRMTVDEEIARSGIRRIIKRPRR